MLPCHPTMTEEGNAYLYQAFEDFIALQKAKKWRPESHGWIKTGGMIGGALWGVLDRPPIGGVGRCCRLTNHGHDFRAQLKIRHMAEDLAAQ